MHSAENFYILRKQRSALIREALVRKLMTDEETAGYLTRLGVQTSARTLAFWRQKGTGPAYLKVEGRIRYRPESIQDWVAQAEREPAGSAA